METEDEPGTYLKLFNEGTQSYLLHSIEDGLSDVFPADSVFTEITSQWPPEGLPILLSTPLTDDENYEDETISVNSNVHIQENAKLRQIKTTRDQTVTLLPNGNASTQILSNDILVQLQDTTENNSVMPMQDNDVEISSGENEEVIQLLNIDGSVTTINKNLLSLRNVQNRTDLKNFFEDVQAKKCKVCSFLCIKEEEIIKHIEQNHKEEVDKQNPGNSQTVIPSTTSVLNANQIKNKCTLYLCSTCGSGYINKDDLKQHMIIHHKMTPTTSSPVPETSQITSPKCKTKNLAVTLLKRQKMNNKFKCPFKGCPHKFDKEESCKKHVECHIEQDQQKKRFMCTICKTKFSLWRVCSMHMWRKHSVDLGLLTCPMCNKFKSYSAVTITTHMSIHKEEKPYICIACGKGFKQLGQLRNHELIHKASGSSGSSHEIICEFCERVFSSNKALKKHIKFVHDKFKPFICNICGHQTSRKEMLQSHYRQHTGDKPFHCSYCEFKTGDRNCLRKHTMRHFGIMTYSCPHCNYKAIQSVSLKNHLIHKHPGKEGLFSCLKCRYTSVNQNAYMSHMKSHELESKKNSKTEKRATVEDNESKSSDETTTFLNTEHSEDAVDTGGITIPAEFDLQLPNDEISLI